MSGCQSLDSQIVGLLVGGFDGLLVGESVGGLIVVTVPEQISSTTQYLPSAKKNASQHCSFVSNKYCPRMLNTSKRRRFFGWQRMINRWNSFLLVYWEEKIFLQWEETCLPIATTCKGCRRMPKSRFTNCRTPGWRVWWSARGWICWWINCSNIARTDIFNYTIFALCKKDFFAALFFRVKQILSSHAWQIPALWVVIATISKQDL
jgi:hypothetical protein